MTVAFALDRTARSETDWSPSRESPPRLCRQTSRTAESACFILIGGDSPEEFLRKTGVGIVEKEISAQACVAGPWAGRKENADMPKARLCTLSMLLLLIALAGCGRTATDDDAIRAAVNAHVAAQGNLNASAFDTEIQKVTIQGNKAQADVAFHLKGGPGVMQPELHIKENRGELGRPAIKSGREAILSTRRSTAAGVPPGAATNGTSSDIFDAIHEQLRTQPSGVATPPGPGR